MSNDFKRQLESEMLKIELEEKQAPAKSYQLAATNQPASSESVPQPPVPERNFPVPLPKCDMLLPIL